MYLATLLRFACETWFTTIVYLVSRLGLSLPYSQRAGAVQAEILFDKAAALLDDVPGPSLF
jgi:hypothetical protein